MIVILINGIKSHVFYDDGKNSDEPISRIIEKDIVGGKVKRIKVWGGRKDAHDRYLEYKKRGQK